MQDDPTSGRGEILLHRAGQWTGELTALDSERKNLGKFSYTEDITQDLNVTIAGGAFDSVTRHLSLTTNQWQAWTTDTSDVVGSYSLSGGRALSGQFYHREAHLRCWRRDVVTLDGKRKAVVQHWYRGGQRVGSQFGVLTFEKA